MNLATSPDFAIRFTLSVGHLLWQVTAIAVLAFFLEWLLRPVANRKHAIYGGALLLSLLCLPMNFLNLGNVPAAGASLVQTTEPLSSSGTEASLAGTMKVGGTGEFQVIRNTPLSPAKTEELTYWSRVAPWILNSYIFGVGLMLFRLAVAFHGTIRLRQSSDPVTDGTWNATLNDLALRLKVTARPTLAWSNRVAGPVIAGLAKPVILLPVALATRLTTAQAEAVLAHELAHLRRKDHWFILAQRLIETVLFFHPAIWWMSARLSNAREEACDDLAITNGCNPADYAEALLLCSQYRGGVGLPGLQLASDGGSPSKLKSRVMRILGRGDRERIWPGRIGWIVSIAILGTLAGLATGQFRGTDSPGIKELSRAERASFRQLTAVWENGSENEIAKSIEALIRMGPDIAPAVIPFLHSGRSDVQAINVLKGLVHHPEVQELLVEEIKTTRQGKYSSLLTLSYSGNVKHVDLIARQYPETALGTVNSLRTLVRNRQTLRLADLAGRQREIPVNSDKFEAMVRNAFPESAIRSGKPVIDGNWLGLAIEAPLQAIGFLNWEDGGSTTPMIPVGEHRDGKRLQYLLREFTGSATVKWRIELDETVIASGPDVVMPRHSPALAALLRGFEEVPLEYWHSLAEAIQSTGEASAVPELKRRLAGLDQGSQAFPPATIPSLLRAIHSLQGGKSRSRNAQTFSQGKRFRYPWPGPGMPLSWSVNPPSTHYLKFPQVDHGSEEGRKAIFKTLKEKTKGAGFIMDRNQLILINGLKAAPLWPDGRPWPGGWGQWLANTPHQRILQHVLDWQQPGHVQAGPIAGITQMPIPDNGLLATTADDQSLVILNLQRTSNNDTWDVSIRPLDPVRLLIPDTGKEPDFSRKRYCDLRDVDAAMKDSALNLRHSHMFRPTPELLQQPTFPFLTVDFNSKNWTLLAPGSARFIVAESHAAWNDAGQAVRVLKLAAAKPDTKFARGFNPSEIDRPYAFAIRMPDGESIAGVFEVNAIEPGENPPRVRLMHKFLPSARAREVFSR